MNIEIKYGKNTKNFDNQTTIIIGNDGGSDFVIEKAKEQIFIKLVYSSKYKNYVLINSLNNENLLFNNKPFSKILVPSRFTISGGGLTDTISVDIGAYKTKIESEEDDIVDERQSVAPSAEETVEEEQPAESPTPVKTKKQVVKDTSEEIFNNEIEKHRIAIVKEVGSKIQALKSSLKSMNVTLFIMNVGMGIMAIVCSFGMTNYLLGLKVDTSKSVLNLSTNYGFLVCMSAVVLAISFILKQAVCSYQEYAHSKRYGENNLAQKAIMCIGALFMLVIYVLNLLYFKDIPGMQVASIFVSLLFAGGLATVSAAGGYFKYQAKNTNYALMNYEYREDFETVLKSYRGLIATYINSMSQNKIEYIKGALINNQMKMFVETVIGLITAPFLAYGVSNTLAMCFPEAANWVRISGLRFSPIFLVLATFLIIFAFFSFVRGFAISKQVNASEIIKFDGFHDFHSHGVTILGLDAMRSLNREKNVVLFIGCFIILIEFTMNVSYFITEIGGDISGMFKSFITALVPTALLIAETHMLSATMHKIRNYSELLSKLD